MDAATASLQNAFQADLSRFLAGRRDGRRQQLAALLWPGAADQRGAATLVARYGELRPRLAAHRAGPVEITMPAYTGNQPQVRAIMDGLADIADLLCGACVHGSLGSDEAVAYSDFDGLVILRHRAFESAQSLAQVTARLRELQRCMLQLDPLQHHGWFVLTEADLDAYCDAYFPAALFSHARSLLPGVGGPLMLRPRDSRAERREAFTALARATVDRLTQDRPPDDMYALKSRLSEIMLLPALYVQARDDRGVFKKESFDLARRDFARDLWAPMVAISAIRADWHYEPGPLRRALLTRPLAARRLVTRWLSPPVPADLKARLTPALWAATARLVNAMLVNSGNSGTVN